MSKLTEILKADTCDLTGELKRAFRPLSPPVEIDGKELDALTILVNLTDKTDDQKDLLTELSVNKNFEMKNGGEPV